jgi:hypothetical protein
LRIFSFWFSEATKKHRTTFYILASSIVMGCLDLAFASAYCFGVSDFFFFLFAFLVAALLFSSALVLLKIPINRSLFLHIRWPSVIPVAPFSPFIFTLRLSCCVFKIPTTTRFLLEFAYFQSEIPPPLASFYFLLQFST